LTWWPSFWPNMTHIRTWPRYCQNKHSDQVIKIRWQIWPLECKKKFLRFDLVTSFLTRHDPYSNLTWILSKQTFWQSFINIWSQIWPLECKQEFSKIWPGDLDFHPTWPIFELGLDIVKTNILTKLLKSGRKSGL